MSSSPIGVKRRTGPSRVSHIDNGSGVTMSTSVP
jgi:hypothetical protein